MPKSARKSVRKPARANAVTSYALGSEANTVIAAQVKSGAYPNASAFVRAAVLREGEREAKRQTLHKLLQEGLESGIDPRSHDEVWDEIEREAFGDDD